MKKISLIFSIMMLLLVKLNAQQDAMFTHYMYNTLWLNPAYAGSRDALTLTGIHRSQWVGFEGAPINQSFTMHSPLMNGKLGAGLSILNDKIGPVNSTFAAIDLSYIAKLDKKSKLSFGIKGMANFFRNKLNEVKLDNATDNSFAGTTNNITPNVGAGVYYFRERFYAGISTPKLLENQLGGNATGVSKEQRHFFFIVGTVFNINKDLKLKPTAFIKATAASPLQGDLTGTFILKEKLNLGAMYRTGDAAGVLVGYNFTEQFYLGYSFDWSFLNTTGRYNAGSHEVMLRYDLISKAKSKIKSPRYF